MALLFVNLTATFMYFINPKFQRENWKEATAYVSANATPTSIVFFESTYSIAPFDYYNKQKISSYGVLDSFNPTRSYVEEKVHIYTKSIDKIFLFQYLSEITDREGLVFQALTDEGYKNTATRDFEGVGFVYEFQR